MFIVIRQTGSNVNSDNSNRQLDYKHLIKYYNLLQNWQKPFTVDIYRLLIGEPLFVCRVL